MNKYADGIFLQPQLRRCNISGQSLIRGRTTTKSKLKNFQISENRSALLNSASSENNDHKMEGRPSSDEDCHIVPYGDLRDCIGMFAHEWRSSLQRASEDYAAAFHRLWRRIFDDVATAKATSTSATATAVVTEQERAIQTYVDTTGETFAALKDLVAALYSAALVNCEALRKLVKKFDKRAAARGDDDLLLSAELFDLGDDDDCAGCNDDNDDENFVSLQRHRIQAPTQKDDPAVKKRADELAWLKGTLATLPTSDLASLVAHRGFHSHRSTLSSDLRHIRQWSLARDLQ